jgi:vacuolar-type H+-ATPase subunit H
MAHNPSNQPAPAAPSADLALLVATEQDLEAKIAQAREQARALIEAAYLEVGANSSELERNLSGARERFQTEVEAERAHRAEEALTEGKRQAAQFDGIPETRVAELAQLVLARLLSGVGG